MCIIGEWKDEQSIAKARDKMIAGLDTVRLLLEEISPELGVTDPVSGPVIMERQIICLKLDYQWVVQKKGQFIKL